MTDHEKWLQAKQHKQRRNVRFAAGQAYLLYFSIGNWEDLRTYYQFKRLTLL